MELSIPWSRATIPAQLTREEDAMNRSPCQKADPPTAPRRHSDLCTAARKPPIVISSSIVRWGMQMSVLHSQPSRALPNSR